MDNDIIDVTTVPVPKDAPHFDGANNADRASGLVVNILLCLIINLGGVYVQYAIEKKGQKNRGV